MPICSCASTGKQTAEAPASVACLCWPRVTRHPSAATPALFHKVNLPFRTWYLLTRLMGIDGCMTFIEFFYEPVLVMTPFIQASVRLGCYSSWTPAPAEKAGLSFFYTHTYTLIETRTDRRLKPLVTLSHSFKVLDWRYIHPPIRRSRNLLCWAQPGLSPYTAYHIIILMRSKSRTFTPSLSINGCFQSQKLSMWRTRKEGELLATNK